MRFLSCIVFLLGVCVLGCGGSDFPVAAVSGKVTCEGKPVAYAMVFFEPLKSGESAMTGKQGFADCNENGEFFISTYGSKDGAVVGKHQVHVMPPHAEDHPKVKCPCEFNSKTEKIEVEVKSGQKNEFTFALPVSKKKAPLTQDELEALEEAAINKATSK